MPRILIVEDDAATAQEIVRELESHGHETVHACDGAAALAALGSSDFDAVTLDRMLPDTDGLAVVAEMRARGFAIPVLMISALSDVDERIAGLRAGGDDYLVKPFAPAEMAARIEVLLRRRGATAERTMLTVGTLSIDLVRRVVARGGLPVPLLHLEYRLLEFLARNHGQTMSRKIIFEQVWGYHFDPGANLIAVHIARLRRKLDRPDHPSPIATVKGEGYRLDAL